MNFHRVWLLLFILALGGAFNFNTRAGHPLQPHRKSQGERDANMALIQFQNALVADRWDDALSLCSSDLQKQAKAWPSAEKFFKDTMPIEHVLARGFGDSFGETFQEMIETISTWDEDPRIDWFWGMALAENGKWVVDYPPVLMKDYVVQRKALIKARNDNVAALKLGLEPKVSFISTRIVPLTNEFMLGQPMLFRIELTNAGPTDVHYHGAAWIRHGVVVRDESGTALTNTLGPSQVVDSPLELPSHSAVVLAEAMDITKNHHIVEPGTYTVQFEGYQLEIGEVMPIKLPGRFGRDGDLEWSQFYSATNKFPSNVVKIDVRR